MIDTGAAMSMVPAKLMKKEDYTGHFKHVKGAVGEHSLPRARVALDVSTTMMTLLVTTEDTTPLLGTDHPTFMRILRDAITVAPDRQAPALQEELHEGLAEQDQQPEVECLPAEGEDVSVENDDIIVNAVKTRQQTAKEKAEQEEDDRVSNESGAIPLDLSQLDDSLFVETQTRKKLTKQEKRVQARERELLPLGATAAQEPRLTALTSQQLEEAQ
jgi:hypothetical protein